MTPYYQDGAVTIWHGDCRALLAGLGADVIVSDPPYGIGYAHAGTGGGKHSRRNTAPVVGDDEPFDPSFLLGFRDAILWGANHFAGALPRGRWLVWDKLDGLASFDSFSDVEFAWQKTGTAGRMFRYLWKGICQAGDKEGGRQHPTQKPVPLMRWCIGLVGDGLILDPFMGSGTTLRAAKDLGRKAIGIEIEERYCEIAAKRMAQEVLAL
jgi:site-specific DNA-methyltransferase (adenine-specific)